MKLADYLFQRLRQLGVGSMHGVPGDYNLELLDYVEPAGLRWVGNTNELNAAYAADAYARIKGIGALVTTFGVGELSAINAIAGAYAERSPIVHIVGIPERGFHDARLKIHHTFNDGEYKRFAQMHSHVTITQTRLWDIRTSQKQIDEALRQCLLHSRPVYIEIPVDMVRAEVSEEPILSPIELSEPTTTTSSEDVLNQVIDKVLSAKQPVILVDGETRPMGVIQDVQRLIETTRWPTWTTPFGKGLLDETIPNFHGIYKGSFDDQEVHSFFGQADLVLCIGPHWSSTNTYANSAIPRPQVTISLTDMEIEFDGKKHRDISPKFALSRITDALGRSQAWRYDPYPNLPRDHKDPLPAASDHQPLTQDRLWHTLANILRPGDIVLGETGTAGYGVRVMPLPKYTRVFTPVTWLSIGYMLPGAQGAALAQQELMQSSNYHDLQDSRTILFIGDGSFQMTAQELSTIIRHNLNVIVFLINNDGYTIERCIHGRNQSYNDIAPWRYLQAPSFFGASSETYIGSAKTWSELGTILADEQLNDGTGLRMVELFVGREDAPKGPLTYLLETQKKRE